MRRLIILPILLLVSGVFAHLAYADLNFVQRHDVQAFILKMVKQHGFNKQQLITLFSEVKLRPQVITNIKQPLEKESWHLYQMLFVNEWRIQHGVLFWNKYNAALKRAEDTYGIPPSIIVATIGIETKYGEKMGEYRVLDALSNLAFSHSQRAPFFRKELEEFLLLTQEEHLDPAHVMGSYAGAMGQGQFMPSSYRYYAVNFSKSGKIDLMHNEIDVIGSIANYYKQHGWQPHQPIAMQAFIIGDRYHYLIRNNTISPPLPYSSLTRYGVVPKNKVKPTQEILKVNVIELQNLYNTEYWLGFHNFDVIKRYNPSDLYAMAVYQLSTYICALRERLNNG